MILPLVLSTLLHVSVCRWTLHSWLSQIGYPYIFQRSPSWFCIEGQFPCNIKWSFELYKTIFSSGWRDLKMVQELADFKTSLNSGCPHTTKVSCRWWLHIIVNLFPLFMTATASPHCPPTHSQANWCYYYKHKRVATNLTETEKEAGDNYNSTFEPTLQ